MARSFSSANLISSFLVDQLVVVARRGYATASTGVRRSGVTMMKKASEESKKSTPWVPDPVTGYYKPEGQTNQIDGADQLRALAERNRDQGGSWHS